MKRLFLVCFMVILASTYAIMPGKTAVKRRPQGQVGIASWYGPGFHMRKAANGKRFDRHGFSCAHRTLPLGTIVRVEVMETGKYMDLPVTDRGPYAKGRILDLSEAAAAWLGIHAQGVAKVRVTKVA